VVGNEICIQAVIATEETPLADNLDSGTPVSQDPNAIGTDTNLVAQDGIPRACKLEATLTVAGNDIVREKRISRGYGCLSRNAEPSVTENICAGAIGPDEVVLDR